MTWFILSFLIFICWVHCSYSKTSSPTECATFKDCVSCQNSTDSVGRCVWCHSDNACYTSLNLCPPKMRAQIPYNCQWNTTTTVQYNETFAKKIALPMMAASAAPDHQTRLNCLESHFIDLRLLANYTVPCNYDNTTKCFAFMSYWPTENAIIIVFRASTPDQVLPQIINFILEKKMRNITVVGGSVDAYYHDAFTKFWELMESDLRDAILTTENAEVWFFGHSLGGGLASITSTFVSAIKMVPSNRIKLVTFGQPRITDNLFAERHDDLVPYSFRIINRHDGLTSIPTRMSELENIGPFHHRYEVWYPDGMSQGSRFVVSIIPEDGSGHDSIGLLLSVDDHVTMFGVVIADWWQNNCSEPIGHSLG